MIRILLTGATGQIGRWVLHELAGRPGLALTLALRDPARQLPALQAWLAERGVQPAQPLQALAFDLDRPDGAAAVVAAARPDVAVHLAARFAWGLPAQAAHRANVQASVALLQAVARRPGARFIHVSGFMLQHRAHLRRLGLGDDVQPHGPGGWPAVYRRAGGYEASKLQAHAEMTHAARELGQPLVVLHPATVAGHSVHGELPEHAALHALCAQLIAGRLAAIPGGAAYRLPLVAVDHVARFTAAVVQDEAVQGGDFLLMDPASPSLPELVATLAEALGRPMPRLALPCRCCAPCCACRAWQHGQARIRSRWTSWCARWRSTPAPPTTWRSAGACRIRRWRRCCAAPPITCAGSLPQAPVAGRATRQSARTYPQAPRKITALPSR
jgi:nucleoside-diphosphate-sugar epimerase